MSQISYFPSISTEFNDRSTIAYYVAGTNSTIQQSAIGILGNVAVIRGLNGGKFHISLETFLGNGVATLRMSRKR